jgi:TFIIF-interacting CTD phosphatase-like protein
VKELGEIVIFSTLGKNQSDAIIDHIDPKGMIKRKFYLEDCKTDANS